MLFQVNSSSKSKTGSAVYATFTVATRFLWCSHTHEDLDSIINDSVAQEQRLAHSSNKMTNNIICRSFREGGGGSARACSPSAPSRLESTRFRPDVRNRHRCRQVLRREHFSCAHGRLLCFLFAAWNFVFWKVGVNRDTGATRRGGTVIVFLGVKQQHEKWWKGRGKVYRGRESFLVSSAGVPQPKG